MSSDLVAKSPQRIKDEEKGHWRAVLHGWVAIRDGSFCSVMASAAATTTRTFVSQPYYEPLLTFYLSIYIYIYIHICGHIETTLLVLCIHGFE